MFISYLRTAWRSLLRQRGYAILNIVGLALGMAVALLIFSYLRVDLRWDRWQTHADRIVRIVELQDFGGDERTDVAVSMGPLGPMLQRELPEVEAYTRVLSWTNPMITQGDVRHYEGDAVYVDSLFFRLFSFPLLAGDPESVFARRDGVVLSEDAVARYFPNDPHPMGRTIRINNSRDAIVTGIVGEASGQSHIDFDVAFPTDILTTDLPHATLDKWGTNNLATYLLLRPDAVTGNELNGRITSAYHRHGEWEGLEFYTQPLTEMHLHSGQIEIDINNGKVDADSLWVLGSIGVFILLLAIINFTNLATARSLTRAREVGLRKVSGARRGELIVQFLGESLLVASIALVLALILVELAGPGFATVGGRDIPGLTDIPTFLLPLALGMTVFVGLLAGFYPALVLSSFRPVKVLKSQDTRTAGGGSLLRRGLVVLQFTISVGLLIATGVIHEQVRYSLSKPLGFDKENVLVIPVQEREFWEQQEDNLAAFARVPGVTAVSASSRMPSRGGSSSGFVPEGSDRSRVMNWNSLDGHARDVFGWELLAGRFLDPNLATDVQHDSAGSMVINEAAARQFGWEDPVGKTIEGQGARFTVVGMVRDYHFSSMTRAIEPMLMFNNPGSRGLVSLRYDRADVNGLVDDVRAVWEERMPDKPFDWRFLDESFDRLFRAQQRQGALLRVFSGVAIVIACLGLLGLAAFATGRRTREIAVRKVLGATEGSVLRLLTREFAVLVLVANVIAWPVAYWAMNRWFEQFAYRTEWPWWVFPAAGGATLLIAVLTVAAQAWKAVRMRPGLALRHE